MKTCGSGIFLRTGAFWFFLAAFPLEIRAQEVSTIHIAFEAPEYTPGLLDGQQGWKVEQGEADIVVGGAHGGEQCLRLLAGDPFAQARLRLEGARPEGTVSFIDFHVRPVASPMDPRGELLEVDGARIGFFLDEDAAAPNRGSFWVFDARAEDGGEWIKAPLSFEVALPAGESPTWIRITIRQDFTRQTWDCWIEGSMVAANLGFQEPHVAQTENYIIMGDAAEHVFLDDLAVTPSNPLGKDSDSDGIPDDIEIRLGTHPFFDDRDEDADGDGLSNLASFVASSLNHTPIVGAGHHQTPTAPAFSRPSGFAGEPFLLEISEAAEGGRVLFTLDGSDPRQKPRQAARYEAPIPIPATSVVRAVQVDASGRMSPTATGAWVFPDSVVDQERPAGVPQILRDLGRSASVPGDYPLPVEMRTRQHPESLWPTAESVASALRSAPVLVLAADESALFGFPDGIYHTPGSHARTGKAPAALTAFHFSGGADALSAPDVVISISGDSSRYHDVSIKHSFRVRFPDSAPLAVGRLLCGRAARPAIAFAPPDPGFMDGWRSVGRPPCGGALFQRCAGRRDPPLTESSGPLAPMGAPLPQPDLLGSV